jgi:hypothetical protein
MTRGVISFISQSVQLRNTPYLTLLNVSCGIQKKKLQKVENGAGTKI